MENLTHTISLDTFHVPTITLSRDYFLGTHKFYTRQQLLFYLTQIHPSISIFPCIYIVSTLLALFSCNLHTFISWHYSSIVLWFSLATCLFNALNHVQFNSMKLITGFFSTITSKSHISCVTYPSCCIEPISISFHEYMYYALLAFNNFAIGLCL